MSVRIGFMFILRPYERGIRETLGRYSGFVGPGAGFQVPIFQLVRVRDIREHTMDIHPQEVITKDNVEIRVDGIMWVRPKSDEESVKRTFYSIDDWQRAVRNMAMTNLRQEFGNLTLDESLVARESIAQNLQESLDHAPVEEVLAGPGAVEQAEQRALREFLDAALAVDDLHDRRVLKGLTVQGFIVDQHD